MIRPELSRPERNRTVDEVNAWQRRHERREAIADVVTAISVLTLIVGLGFMVLVITGVI